MDELAIFENFKIRRHYNIATEEWLFSVVDIISALTDQKEFQKARKYWNKLKERLKKESGEPVTNCHQLKMRAQDEKMRLTDMANVETIFRLIQSVPSPKAEPIKLWLAKVGHERIQELANPEQALDRARDHWKKLGRSEKWIQQRMMSQETRNKLTDYWKDHGVKAGTEYASLTNIIHQEWSDLSIYQHKKLKGLESQNLRDHMNEAELSTRQIAENMQTDGFRENKIPAKKGGEIAKNARKELEDKIGKSVVTGENYLPTTLKKKK